MAKGQADVTTHSYFRYRLLIPRTKLREFAVAEMLFKQGFGKQYQDEHVFMSSQSYHAICVL